MDWLTFISSLFNSWRLSVVLIILIFRKQISSNLKIHTTPLGNKIEELTKVKIRNIKAEFAKKEVNKTLEISDKVSNVLPNKSPKPSSSIFNAKNMMGTDIFEDLKFKIPASPFMGEDFTPQNSLSDILIDIPSWRFDSTNINNLETIPSALNGANNEIQKQKELASTLAKFDSLDSLEKIFLHFETIIDPQFSKVIRQNSISETYYSQWPIINKLFYLAHDNIIDHQLYEEVIALYELKDDENTANEMKHNLIKVSEILKRFAMIIENNVREYVAKNSTGS